MKFGGVESWQDAARRQQMPFLSTRPQRSPGGVPCVGDDDGDDDAGNGSGRRSRRRRSGGTTSPRHQPAGLVGGWSGPTLARSGVPGTGVKCRRLPGGGQGRWGGSSADGRAIEAMDSWAQEFYSKGPLPHLSRMTKSRRRPSGGMLPVGGTPDLPPARLIHFSNAKNTPGLAGRECNGRATYPPNSSTKTGATGHRRSTAHSGPPITAWRSAWTTR